MKNKIELSAGGIVFKNTDEGVLWLVTQHSEHKGWGFPKGLIGDTVENELKEEASLREVREEGGIEARIIHPEPVKTEYSYNMQNTKVYKTVWYFLMKYVSGDPKDHDWEVSEAIFLPESEIISKLTFESDKKAFRKILKIFNKKIYTKSNEQKK